MRTVSSSPEFEAAAVVVASVVIVIAVVVGAKITFFRLYLYTTEYLTRIQRVLRMDQGHCLLVGMGGSGKQSLTKLAAYAADCEVFEIELSRGYDEYYFREDLKLSAAAAAAA